MNRKYIVISGLILMNAITGCAVAKLGNEWKNERGYSDGDIDLIRRQFREYSSQMVAATQSSNAFNTAPVTETRNRLRNIFCACAKKLGDKCRQKPDGISPSDKTLWVKANAVDMAMTGLATTWETNGMTLIDPAECN